MGKKDTVTTKYLRRNMIFADLFNYYVYDGEQVIRPESLEELDTREIAVPYGGEKRAEQPVQRIRDIIKSVVAMTDGKRAFLILCAENQANIHYAISVKNMLYDALHYAKQVENAVASHKESGDYKGADGNEYLSGFMKDDRLIPVVTLTVYWGTKEWNGSTSIHEMFGEQDEKILSLVPDYKTNLIVPAAMGDEEFDKFHTTLKEVLCFIKCSPDKEKLAKAVEKGEGFRHLGRDEVDVLNACVGARLRMEKSKEECDVCKAIQDMMEDAAREARKEAQKEVEKVVKEAKKAAREAKKETKEVKKATKKAVEEERVSTLLETLKNLMGNMGLTAEQSMDAMGVPKREREVLASLL
ncbi:MAG: hypothetical protein HFH23_17230 [Ruminococcus sp.]|nr:hypothetical protein [Ruminococcus sp.]